MIGIYKITNPKGKVYIGQSIDVNKRVKDYNNPQAYQTGKKILNSILKYGIENHEIDIIEECNRENLNDREVFWIKEYNSVEEGLNIQSGGESYKMEQSTKELIRQKMIGKNTRKITQYSTTLDFIQVWDSIREAEDEYGKGIKNVLAKKTYTAGGFIWRYEGEVVDYRDLPPKHHHNSKSVIQYDLEGNIVKEWNSLMDVERAKGWKSANISSAMSKKHPQKTAFGFIWKKKIK